jgi:hypothetical protein
MTMYPKLERPPCPVFLEVRSIVRTRPKPGSPPPEDSPSDHTSGALDESPCDPVDPSLSNLWSTWPGRVHAHAAE